jgi:integrase
MSDGGGLYLQVSETGGKSWSFRFMLAGRAREMGLGPVHTISLAEARQAARDCRKLRLEGIDPIEARKQRQESATAKGGAMTFPGCAEAYIRAHESGWRNPKHVQQWRKTLETYAYPVFGALPVEQIELPSVMRVLEPIWREKAETASRVRGRIESVLDWATVRGYRKGDNPARWRGHLDTLLPARSKVQKVTHHPALPYVKLPSFIRNLQEQKGIAARALEFLILTAARTSEAIGAQWSEFDLDQRMWTIPAERIKSRREHRVPLGDRALAILAELQVQDSRVVFPGGKIGKPLSNMALLAVLKRMKRTDLTAHGFRSTFRDWAAEQTNFPREVAEMALAHTVGDKVEAAYRRGDLFEKRIEIMHKWDQFARTS